MKKLLDKNHRSIITRLLIIAAMSILTMAFIEWRFFDNDIERASEFIFVTSLVFFYNAMLLFFLELIVSSFFKKPWTGPGIMFIVAIIISYITVQKQHFRGQPLLPEDFMLADQTGTITKFIDFGSLFRTILACIIAFGLMMILNYLTRNYFDVKDEAESKTFWGKNLRIFRLVILIIGVVGFVNYSDFARNHSGEREEEVPQIGSYFIAWNQMYNYEANGFIIGFLYNWSKFDLKAPDGYSEEKVTEIKTSYSDQDGKNSLNDADYNIVIVLNESFSDPEVIADYYKITSNNVGSKNIDGVEITEDVIPTLHKMIKTSGEAKNYVTGQMYSIDYGGGTANIEFEVDTSMSNYFLNTTPFVDLLPRTDKVPSIYQIAKENGYKTFAIHPFNGGMYKRNIALKKEGIDTFIDEDEMQIKVHDYSREYVNDRSSYSETIKYLRENNEKVIISLITMQNHAGYDKDSSRDYSYTVSGDVKDSEKEQLEVYLESLHNSDYYLSEFLNKLEELNEKTVVLWYGDHYPGIVETVESNSEKEVRDLAHLTPYFVWANFDLENKFDAPTTSPNCLTNTMFNLLNLEKPDYMRLVDEVCKETPILAQSYYTTEGPFKSTALSSYELFIYDILGGKQYWYQK